LDRLIEAAALHREVGLSQVAARASALAATRAQHASLEPKPVEGVEPALHVADFRHQIWAERRRALIVKVMQRQEAELQQARAAASVSLARHETLKTVMKKRRDQLS